ncbi:glycosyl transferase family 25 [Leptolyngbya sp. BL0902]|uniref:glycosyltransferase family 25 protein n=1 Tax=Leptolyngbya sp. BL0902 TaxID=1115757 RepID=UPI0018E7659F|nr:glycosyltransferase family 25 protein [Leptolyngbya sp. BL0902]QQE65054.1 glycosyl transferase family 25 [Leptolyngbya sp. BL0902]
MVLQNLFERTYIINLPERADRRQEIQAELKTIGSDLAPGKVEFFEAIKPTDYGAFPRREVLGCLLSHLHILKIAKAENLENVLIIEDDLAISKRIQRVAQYLPDFLQSTDWDILFLGFLPRYGLQFKDYYQEPVEQEINQYTARSFSAKITNKPLRGTHFYAVNRKIYTPLIHYLEELLNQRFKEASAVSIQSFDNLDGAYLDTAYFLFNQAHKNTRIFIVCPPLGWQRSSRSDINPSRLDRLEGLSFLLTIYRGIKSFVKKNMESVHPFFFSR